MSIMSYRLHYFVVRTSRGLHSKQRENEQVTAKKKLFALDD